MKGLIWKDCRIARKKQSLLASLFSFALFFYVIYKMPHGYGLYTILLLAIPCSSLGAAITLMELDEKCDFNRTMLAMPFTRKDIVISRFFSSALSMIPVLVQGIILMIIHELIHAMFPVEFYVQMFLLCVLLSWFYNCMSVMTTFLMNINRSALVMMIGMVAMIVIYALIFLMDVDVSWFFHQSPWVLLGLFASIVAIETLICIKISYMFYCRHHR